MTVEAEEVFFTNLLDLVVRTFKHDAENRGLSFDVRVEPGLGSAMVTDSKRLQQILKNLLSNAFKFTAQGGVRLNVSEVSRGWTPGHPLLSQAARVVAFEVPDTGIGIPPEKQRIIFEAFQQADASTSRKYGGTGLGLAISRELASLLGGEIQLRSNPGHGSTFTLYLPLRYVGPNAVGLRDSAGVPSAPSHGQPAGAGPRPRACASSRSPTTASTSSRASRRCWSSRTTRTTRGCWSTSPTITASRCWPRRAAPTRWRWRASTGRPRCRSTSSCPTCSAGPCSAS